MQIFEKKSQTVAFYTLGCKTNQLETATFANEFKEKSWTTVPFDEAANVYVINTCTVTERSDNESQRIIRRARLSNPNAKIVVTGCYAQVAPEEVASQLGVTHVIGNNFKDQLLTILENTRFDDRQVVQVSEIDKSRIMEGASAGAIDNEGNTRTRGSLKIQDGCDYKCTYCIIWEARGLSRSLPLQDVKQSLQVMIWEGFKEIVLTGINIGQYDYDGYDLADLLAELIQLEGDFRLRLTSLDPLEMPNKLIDVVANSNGKICPHFHLSAQSAEDVVLKRMGRRHHVTDMIRICETIHQKIPHCSIGSDIIVGFPGETEERFNDTYEVLKSVPMNYFHVFSYSKRKGTPAADFPDQIPDKEKKRRANLLKMLSDEKSLAFRSQFVGTQREVIVEDSCEKGMTDNYIRVNIMIPEHCKANDKKPLTINHLEDHITFAII